MSARHVLSGSPTQFQRRVFSALMEIPCGRVTTYGALARMIGCGSARAVGHALRQNLDSPRVPCHRVIAADGSPGGFKGQRQGPAIAEKLRLLAAEGIHFANDRLVDQQCLWVNVHGSRFKVHS